MADLKQVKTRLLTAHTSVTAGCGLLETLTSEVRGDSSEPRYMQREMHKILGRIEALIAGIDHQLSRAPKAPRKRTRRSTIEAGGEDAPV